jgi:hypothetical protein
MVPFPPPWDVTKQLYKKAKQEQGPQDLVKRLIPMKKVKYKREHAGLWYN